VIHEIIVKNPGLMAGYQKPFHGRAEPYIGLGSEELHKTVLLLRGDQLLAEITTPGVTWIFQ